MILSVLKKLVTAPIFFIPVLGTIFLFIIAGILEKRGIVNVDGKKSAILVGRIEFVIKSLFLSVVGVLAFLGTQRLLMWSNGTLRISYVATLFIIDLLLIIFPMNYLAKKEGWNSLPSIFFTLISILYAIFFLFAGGPCHAEGCLVQVPALFAGIFLGISVLAQMVAWIVVRFMKIEPKEKQNNSGTNK